MYYNWDRKDFSNSLSILRKMIDVEKDIDKKYYLESILAHESNLFLSEFEVPLINSRATSNTEKLTNIASNLAFYERNYRDLATYAEILEPVLDATYTLDNSIEMFAEKLPLKYIKHNELLEIAKNIIGNMDDDFYKLYMEFYKDRFKSVKFYNEDNPLAIAGINGESNYIDKVNRVFIKIKNSTGVNKIACFLHECGHVTAMKMNPQRWHLCEQSFYDEIESIFFELVAIYEIKNEFSIDEINFYLYEFLISQLENLNTLNWQEDIIKLWKYNNFVYDRNLLRIIREKISLTKQNVQNVLNTSILDDGVYIISYTIAVKLFSIYKQNKNEAIKILKRIMLIPYNKIAEIELKKIIDVDDSLLTESMGIVDEMKLSLRNNGYKI